MPNISSLNYGSAQTVANSVIVPVGQDGKIDLTNLGALAGNVDLIADVTGYFSADSASAYVPITPTRVLETRSATAVAPGASIMVDTQGVVATLPVDVAYSETAFVVNTTVTEAGTVQLIVDLFGYFGTDQAPM